MMPRIAIEDVGLNCSIPMALSYPTCPIGPSRQISPGLPLPLPPPPFEYTVLHTKEFRHTPHCDLKGLVDDLSSDDCWLLVGEVLDV